MKEDELNKNIESEAGLDENVVDIKADLDEKLNVLWKGLFLFWPDCKILLISFVTNVVIQFIVLVAYLGHEEGSQWQVFNLGF